MLKELLPLLRKGDTLGLSIACESAAGPDPVAQPAQYRINILPKLFTMDGEKGPDRLALNTPITITGTGGELDSPAFSETLNRFTSSAAALRHTIDEVETTHKQAAAAKVAAPTKSKGGTLTPHKPKVPAKPAPKPGASKASWKDRVKPKVTASPATVAEGATDAAATAAAAVPGGAEVVEPQAPKNAAEATPTLI